MLTHESNSVMRTGAAMKVLLAAAAVVSAGLPLTPVRAQAPPTFEVVSVKKAVPLNAGAVRIGTAYEGDRWTATGVTLVMLVRQAYPDKSMEGQVLGGPAWSTADRFDIVAKTSGRVPREELAMMIRTLLRDRFKFAAHSETRELNALVLTPARCDGRLGPKMGQTTVDCAELRAARQRGEVPAVPPKPGDTAMLCGTQLMVSPESWRIISGGMTSGELATMLTKPLGRPVVDRTGLSGFYEVDVEFAREQIGAPGPAGGRDPGPAAASPDLPTIYVALPEQLGLKLESKREHIEVLVIDAAQQPSED
jgi:uncharacterized protein (TIGR03435 family)